MKKKYIITEAKQIKQYYEKNKRMPMTNTYEDGKILSVYSTCYLMAELIKNWNTSDVKLSDVIKYNRESYRDTIREKVLREDYMKMVDNFIGYCRQYKRVPTFITTQKSKTKVSFELFTYCLSKIIIFYQNNGYLPNYCHFNSSDLQYNKSSEKSSSKSEGKPIASCQNKINSAKGCDAMGQNNSFYCGVCALQKCLYKFGIKETQKQLARVCGTTSAGTSHSGLRTGVAWVGRKYGVRLTVKEAYFSDYTLRQLRDIICDKDKAIICHSLYRNKYGHYECWKSVNVDKKEIEVVNSLGDKCALGCFCGYIERRDYSTQKSYCNGISQKSLIIIERG